MILVTVLMVAFIALLTWAWVKGIDDMNENHPEYKGEDFLSIKGDVPWEDDEWDNSHHNEDV
jgi:hypothetical protein